MYVDLFGGSGLLSHTVKYYYPDAQVVYNDFDNYSERISNVAMINELLAKLRPVLADVPRNKKLPEEVKAKVLEIVKQADKDGFVDYITLSSSILFSMNYATSFEELSKQTMYNSIRRTDYKADGYLVDVDIVSEDYKQLYEAYKDVENAIFLVDPPYLSTDVSTYKDMDYWGIGDYLDILTMLEGSKYVYFTSNKSQIVELCEWFETSTLDGNPFKYSQTATVQQHVNYSSTYTDKMIYKVD